MKLKMHTPDFTDENIARIAELFPSCVTESRDDDGTVKRAIDFDQLRQELSGNIVEGPLERYQLNWPGKREALLTANAPIAKTLRPCREESVDFDTTKNLFIEGDNLDALKLLQETYLCKVKMIYIDPPYNTGNDFIYEDDFAEDKDAYFERSMQVDGEGNRLVVNADSNGRFHSDWLSMLYPRLKLARNLLRDDGVIFISISDDEQANLKRLCDEVFGEINLAACLPWQSRLSIQNDTDLSVNHEYILIYAKMRRIENRRLKESNASSWFKKDSFVFRPLPLDKDKFDNPDNDPRGLWKADPFDAPNVRPNLTYPVTNPVTGEQHLPPSGRCWRISEEKFSSALVEGRIIFGKSGTGRPQMKSFYEEKKDFGSIDNSWFSGEKVGTTTAGTKELQSLFSDAPFDTPKPITLLCKLLEIGFVEKSDIVLDFFSGSATTAHAVMQLNAEDGGNRQFIMVQLPEETDEKSEAFKAGYKTIAEIGKERIRRAGKKIKEEAGLLGKDLDIGFRVLKIDSSNMKDVYYSPDEQAQPDLPYQITNIKEDRTAEDLLFQVLLDWGVDLSLPIVREKLTIDNGKLTVADPNSQLSTVSSQFEVFFVDDNALAACFDDGISENLIKELAKRHPLRVVFRDSGFASDDAKINAEQIFKQMSPATEVRSI